MMEKNKKINKILVIRFRRVGDAVLSSVLCTNLRLNFPDAEIHYLVDSSMSGLFQEHPDIDRVIAFPNREHYKPISYIRKVRQLMRTERYDVIIDTRATVKTLLFSLFSLSTPYRIGEWKYYSLFLHNYRIKNQRPDGPDEVSRKLMLLAPFERLQEMEYTPDFRLSVSEKEIYDFRKYMKGKGVDFSKPVILCAPFTRIEGKEWKMERMQEVLRRIIDYTGAQLVVNSSREEKPKAMQLYRDMGKHPLLLVELEANSLRELGALMNSCCFFFGNEGGVRHLAQAFGVPGLALYPAYTNKIKWLPNPSERYQGLTPSDLFTEEELSGLSDKKRYNLLTMDHVWDRLLPMLDKYVLQKVGTETTSYDKSSQYIRIYYRDKPSGYIED